MLPFRPLNSLHFAAVTEIIVAAMPKGKRTVNNRGQMELAPGVMRFSRARMFHKKGLWAKKPFKAVKVAKKPKDEFIVKKVGGKSNGGERKVRKVKEVRFDLTKFSFAILSQPRRLCEYRTPLTRAAHKRKSLPNHHLRKSIVPGTVLILLAGRHKGKRVVFLKQMAKSGLLLVTGARSLAH